MQRGILVINAGSSSIKFAAYRDDAAADPVLLGKGQLSGIGSAPHFAVNDHHGQKVAEHRWAEADALDHAGALRFLIEWVSSHDSNIEIVAAGHRVVHGGLQYSGPVRIDAAVMEHLRTLEPLAPLHQPHNLNAIRCVAAEFPRLAQVACFDTAFHRTQEQLAQIFALPWDLTEQGVRRYGFHGLSYEYIARQLPHFVPKAERVVVAHLGSGASMCALRNGQSVDSTMGFTAVDGLPMGTRTGALDPGSLLYFMQVLGWDAERIQRLLYKESGLLGVSGISNDMRVLLQSEDPRARLAIELFCYAIAKHLGALTAVLKGLDALVFTAGIGEHAAAIREKVCRSAEWLGVAIDVDANAGGGPCITSAASRVSAWVIPTDEEKMIAIHTRRVLAG